MLSFGEQSSPFDENRSSKDRHRQALNRTCNIVKCSNKIRFTLPICKMRQLYNSIHGGMRRLSACVGVNEIMLPKWKVCMCACVCMATQPPTSQIRPSSTSSPASSWTLSPETHIRSLRAETVIHRPLTGPSWHSLSPGEEKGQARGKYHQIESRRHFRIYIPPVKRIKRQLQ